VRLAIGILVPGLLVLVALLMPMAPQSPSWLGFAWESRRINGIQLALGAGIPIAIGIWGIARHRILRWQSIVTAAGFGVVFLKVQLYRELTHLGDAPLSLQVMTPAVLGGLAVSLVAMVVASDA
jgi:hypothetical protein